MLHPPWTAAQVKALNQWQAAPHLHSFVCGTASCRSVLVATPTGWECPHCPYRQDWAHDFMVLPPPRLEGPRAIPGHKMYLGDGVYVDHDGYALILTTEDGLAVTNRIVIEPEVYSALTAYAKQFRNSEGR